MSCQEKHLNSQLVVKQRCIVNDSVLFFRSEKKNIKPIDNDFIFIDDSDLYVYFNGCKDEKSSIDSCMSFINKNIIYPETAIKDGIEGKVLVKFQIDVNGKISNISLLNKLSPEIDNELIRVFSNMPDWNWDENLDFKVRKSTFRIVPVNFCLN